MTTFELLVKFVKQNYNITEEQFHKEYWKIPHHLLKSWKKRGYPKTTAATYSPDDVARIITDPPREILEVFGSATNIIARFYAYIKKAGYPENEIPCENTAQEFRAFLVSFLREDFCFEKGKKAGKRSADSKEYQNAHEDITVTHRKSIHSRICETVFFIVERVTLVADADEAMWIYALIEECTLYMSKVVDIANKVLIDYISRFLIEIKRHLKSGCADFNSIVNIAYRRNILQHLSVKIDKMNVDENTDFEELIASDNYLSNRELLLSDAMSYVLDLIKNESKHAVNGTHYCIIIMSLRNPCISISSEEDLCKCVLEQIPEYYEMLLESLFSE